MNGGGCRNRAFCYIFCSYVLVYKVPCSKTNLNLGITSRLSWLDQMQRYLDDVFHCQLYCKKIEISMNTHWKSYIIEMLMIYDYYSPHLWKFIEFKIFHYFFYQWMYNVLYMHVFTAASVPAMTGSVCMRSFLWQCSLFRYDLQSLKFGLVPAKAGSVHLVSQTSIEAGTVHWRTATI